MLPGTLSPVSAVAAALLVVSHYLRPPTPVVIPASEQHCHCNCGVFRESKPECLVVVRDIVCGHAPDQQCPGTWTEAWKPSSARADTV